MKTYGYLYECEIKTIGAMLYWRERKIRALTFAIELHTNLNNKYFNKVEELART